MTVQATFQTRARAIDHLGRGQIADCPTAVTELWKNSFDAYARNVSLHIFEGKPNVATILDDGCGMTRNDIDEKWLVIGTSSKTEGHDVPEADRLGLSVRPKLGEKGIGRLAAGFLAPVTLLVTKKQKSKFVAVLVDWRLFENPNLMISDIGIPIEEFAKIGELPALIPKMVEECKKNLDGGNVEGKAEENRVIAAWKALSKEERKQGAEVTTESRIRALDFSNLEIDRLLEHWHLQGDADTAHGTALLLVGLNRELSIWVDPRVESDDPEVNEVREKLKFTLSGFVDPNDSIIQNFQYLAEYHKSDRSSVIIDSTNNHLDSEWLQTLEHYVFGEVSSKGWFNGKIKGFGKSQGETRFRLNVPGLVDAKGKSKIGEFTFEIAAAEQELKNTSHDATELQAIKKTQDSFAGMLVYRDGVRVLPYGRPDSDFFELEARRGKHAGREFWAHRRVFGRVRITRDGNYRLKDKAGREGLVDNEAKRLFKDAVVEVLKTLARKYFGGADTSIRHEEIARVKAGKERGEKSRINIRQTRRKAFLVSLKEVTKAIGTLNPQFEALVATHQRAAREKDEKLLLSVLESIEQFKDSLGDIELPALPKGLEHREQEYREARDYLENYDVNLPDIEAEALAILQKIKKSNPREMVDEFRAKELNAMKRQVKSQIEGISERAAKLVSLWESRLNQNLTSFNDDSKAVVEEVEDDVAWGIGEIQELSEQFSAMVVGHAVSVQRSIDLLLEGNDIDSALAISDEGEQYANDKIQQLMLLAQSGIAVELIGHELEEMAQETESNFKRMPDNCKSSAAYKRAFSGFASLVDRFRFLSPFSVASYRSRQQISGAEIAHFVDEFFARRFQISEVDFRVSSAFEKITFTDLPSRIYPVFVNLVNNSLYWLKFSNKKQIRFDAKDGLVIVSDSGPGVDRDDINSLFSMFFTKRPQGRGIGLYLAKSNLAVARHQIRYATENDPVVLNGANFIIEFKGVVND